jgi:hypothetical protein
VAHMEETINVYKILVRKHEGKMPFLISNCKREVVYMSRVGVYLVTIKKGFGFDDWIFCTLYFHTTRDYRQLQCCLCSTHFTVHRYTRTRILILH